ncbi:MAG: hypothetical protein QW194_02440 [Candidatus Micrarchaeaceae archaeon]|nr:hypothetical protein [Candidatus Marsarchaeota archaeon]
MAGEQQTAKASTYDDLVKYLKELEGKATQSPRSTIDLSPLFNMKSERSKITYIDMVNLIDSLESRKPIRGVEGQKIAPHMEVAGVTQAQYSQMGQVATPQKTAAMEQPLAGKSAAAGAEVADLTREINVPRIKGFDIKKINESDLVLPNLSMADQISELEKILEGLKENVFDDKHIGVVIEELYGLADVTNQEKRRLKKNRISMSQLEQSLWALRDDRLNTAISLLTAARSSLNSKK